MVAVEVRNQNDVNFRPTNTVLLEYDLCALSTVNQAATVANTQILGTCPAPRDRPGGGSTKSSKRKLHDGLEVGRGLVAVVGIDFPLQFLHENVVHRFINSRDDGEDAVEARNFNELPDVAVVDAREDERP